MQRIGRKSKLMNFNPCGFSNKMLNGIKRFTFLIFFFRFKKHFVNINVETRHTQKKLVNWPSSNMCLHIGWTYNANETALWKSNIEYIRSKKKEMPTVKLIVVHSICAHIKRSLYSITYVTNTANKIRKSIMFLDCRRSFCDIPVPICQPNIYQNEYSP